MLTGGGSVRGQAAVAPGMGRHRMRAAARGRERGEGGRDEGRRGPVVEDGAGGREPEKRRTRGRRAGERRAGAAAVGQEAEDDDGDFRFSF